MCTKEFAVCRVVSFAGVEGRENEQKYLQTKTNLFLHSLINRRCGKMGEFLTHVLIHSARSHHKHVCLVWQTHHTRTQFFESFVQTDARHLPVPALRRAGQGCRIWHLSCVKLAPNETNLGFFKISFSTFWRFFL